MSFKKLFELNTRLKSMTVLRDFATSPVAMSFSELIDDMNEFSPTILDSYGKFCSEIYKVGGDLGLIVKHYIETGDNLYVEKHISGEVTAEMKDALNIDLETLQLFSRIKSSEIQSIIQEIIEMEGVAISHWSNTAVSVKKEWASLIKNLNTKGYGVFAKSPVLKVRGEELLPVEKADYQSLEQLYCYDGERKLVLENTKALANGKIASNVLLYGDAGTGKSTTVKACAMAYQDKGVRLIEFKKNQISMIPVLAEKLAKSPLKFIFFIDDLTFVENDENYYDLKGILEGNVSGTAPNILIYATSNRRHLVKESMGDRDGDDIHLNDTLQETMSLASRFGLTVTFTKPEKEVYLSIVTELAKEYGLLSKFKAGTKAYNDALEDILLRSEAFAIRANGRSPRTAKQFVILAKNNLR